MNASDTSSKKLVEDGMNINNLDGWMDGQQKTNALGVTTTNRTCLIMDGVHGMSAGDRGGVGALNAPIRRTRIPIICIANDAGAKKLKSLTSTTCKLPFRNVVEPPSNRNTSSTSCSPWLIAERVAKLVHLLTVHHGISFPLPVAPSLKLSCIRSVISHHFRVSSSSPMASISFS